MTNLLGNSLHSLGKNRYFLATNLSSRPERSWAFSPPKVMKNVFSAVESQLPNRIVIPTEAYPDFLPRGASNDYGCGSPQREAHELHQRHYTEQEIRGSVVEGPAVAFLAFS